MDISSLKPTTFESLKRLAKHIRKERGVPLHEAQHLAAVQAGYANFRHAQNSLSIANPVSEPAQSASIVTYPVRITAEWFAGMNADVPAGRETLTIYLPKPLFEVAQVVDANESRSLMNFPFKDDCQLKYLGLTHSQASARLAIAKAARTLEFMAATGLRPRMTIRPSIHASMDRRSLPGQDHTTTWFDPETKRTLMCDEPYALAVQSLHAQRAAWAEENGFQYGKSQWQGMYAPEGGTEMYLFSRKETGLDIAPVLKALASLPAPVDPSQWTGESEAMDPSPITSRDKAVAVMMTPKRQDNLQPVRSRLDDRLII